ncbi:hypothetical protein NLJ89_g9296 [Agrocybe chaxingu]|uniref:Uncharacterized protein n=1 Tax=Agrocybe chaxingu TaxID=84603 RepID=A0A9W8JTT8_9AGAR|nr:hypothetical protein NLJ89_g9296 [Agrocybe chaxingu]
MRPVAQRIVSTNGAKPHSATPESGPSNKLREMTRKELEQWHKSLHRRDEYEPSFDDLDEASDYPFQDQDSVWVCTKQKKWCPGKVTGRTPRIGNTRIRKEGHFYAVSFGSRSHLRKYFAPLNGEMKPDSEEVRELLRSDGWLPDDDEMSDSGSNYTDS